MSESTSIFSVDRDKVKMMSFINPTRATLINITLANPLILYLFRYRKSSLIGTLHLYGYREYYLLLRPYIFLSFLPIIFLYIYTLWKSSQSRTKIIPETKFFLWQKLVYDANQSIRFIFQWAVLTVLAMKLSSRNATWRDDAYDAKLRGLKYWLCFLSGVFPWTSDLNFPVLVSLWIKVEK